MERIKINGSEKQRYMGKWPGGVPIRPLTVTANPIPLYTELKYMFSWDNKLNPRRTIIISNNEQGKE